MLESENILQTYRCIRSKGKEINSQLLEGLKASDVKIAARSLGMLKGSTIDLNSDEETDRLYDFMVYDYRYLDGCNLMSRYARDNNLLVGIEEDLIEAAVNSNTSLYKVVDTFPIEKRIEVENILEPRKNFKILDLGFSSCSFIKGMLLFTRVLKFSKFNITTGAPLVFSGEHEDILLKKYQTKMRKVVIGDDHTKLAVAFHLLYNLYGFKRVVHKEA